MNRKLLTLAIVVSASCTCAKEQAPSNLDLVRLAIHQAEEVHNYPTQDQIEESLAIILADIDENKRQEPTNPEDYEQEAHRLVVEYYFVK